MQRPNVFSNTEMRDMLCVYAQENYSCLAATQRYGEMYPDRVQPNHQTFRNIFRRLGETGQFKPKRDVGRPKLISVDQEDDILVRIAENPQLSTRRLSSMTGVSQSTVFRILKKENLKPYHFTPVQNLLPRDLPARLNFAQSMVNKKMKIVTFIKMLSLATKLHVRGEEYLTGGIATVGILKILIYIVSHIFNTSLKLMFGAVYSETVC